METKWPHSSFPTYHIVMIGNTKSGKSSMLSALDNRFKANEPATIGVEFKAVPFNVGTVDDPIMRKLNIWDLAGQDRFRSLLTGYYSNKQACIFVLDPTQKLDKQLTNWEKAFKDLVEKNPNIHVHVVVNKSDVDVENKLWDIEGEAGQENIKKIQGFLSGFNPAPKSDFTRFSAKENQGNGISVEGKKLEEEGIDGMSFFERVAKGIFESLREGKEVIETVPKKQDMPVGPSIPSWSTRTKREVGGGIGVGVTVAATFFTLAAFTAGSFLTFGILPSVFIGAALITVVAIGIYGLGCFIYNQIVPDKPPAGGMISDNPPGGGWGNSVASRSQPHNQQYNKWVRDPVIKKEERKDPAEPQIKKDTAPTIKGGPGGSETG